MIPRVLWRLQWGVLFVSLLIYIIRFTYFWGARDLEFWKFCLADSLPLHTLRKGNDAIDVLSYADSTRKKEKWKGDRHTPPCQVENVSMLRETWAEAQGPSPCEAANDGIEVKRKVSLQEGNKLEVPRCLKIVQYWHWIWWHHEPNTKEEEEEGWGRRRVIQPVILWLKRLHLRKSLMKYNCRSLAAQLTHLK